MSIAAGARLGVYEVVAPLGAGGMGEVYRARDTKLGRDVALKILPSGFSRDPERLGRFQREAQLLAALNHPHIGAIYGLEESDAVQFLVLELVEGETLATRLSHGRLPLDEALKIAREIIDALEAAHEKGIIHRDLKPSNIALTSDGHVKVLDFGLAKAMEPIGAASEISPVGVTHSPTLTVAATQAGVILGTAAYMSPEQAKGRAADKRSDVWAFGCVLFEMLAGVRPFEGEDVSDTMAAVLRGEPAWNALPADVPAPVHSVIRRCLAKDRRTRIPDVSVVRFLLDDAVGATAGFGGPLQTPGRRSRARQLIPWGIAALAVALAAVILTLWAPWRAAPAVIPMRLKAELGADVSLNTGLGAAAVLSPDGRVLVFAANAESGTRPQLYVRRLDQLQATVLAGTEDAVAPFFSPDGQWIAFFAGGKLKKVAVSGGAAVTLTDATTPRGGVWAEDDSIIFAPASVGSLARVSSAGGAAEPFTTLGDGEGMHRWPDVLPGGRVLYTTAPGSAFSGEAATLNIREPDGTARVLLRGGYHGRYVRSGHIVYMTNGTLFAAPFDDKRAALAGPAAPVLEAVATNLVNGATQFAQSTAGTAAYLQGQATSNEAPISWLDQSGKPQPLRGMPSNWSNPEFAPDGRRLAIDISEGTPADIWIYEWERDTLSRLTFDAADDQRPIWTRDGRRIAFASRRGDKTTFNIYWQRADGTGEVQRLTESKSQQMTGSFHPSGKFMAFSEQNQATAGDIMILPIEGDETTGWKPGKPTVFLQTPQGESSPMFSPDGRWIAYISNETGRNEIYVRPFPGPGGKWQVSTAVADDPTWSPDGRQLFFASANDLQVMVAAVSVEGDSFRSDKPRVWSEGRFIARPRPPSRDWGIHPDGRRFAVAAQLQPEAQVKLNQVVFIFNFFDELRRVTKSN